MCFIKKKIFPKVEIFVKTVCLSRGTKIGENRPKLALFNSWNISTAFSGIVYKHLRNALTKNELNRNSLRYPEKIN